MKVALVYDRVNKWGGAERVLLVLHEMFPDAPLFTSVYNPKTASWAKVFPKVIPSFLQKLPLAIDNHEHYPLLMPMAFESYNFDSYDLVITVTSEAAKGIVTKPQTKHICYCLTPTRYLWSGYKDYFTNSTFRFLSKPVISYLKSWDLVASQRPDVVIAISSEVKKRVKEYYRRDAKVIFPPLTIYNDAEPRKKKPSDYYLLVSRLVKYKKVDLVIETFNEMGENLVIVGTGKLERKLKSMAKDNVKFLGELTEEDLVDYYSNARALIFPQKEDFGLVAVEAQSFGIPVIAFKAGGALDIVVEGKTGVYFNKQNRKSLKKAINKFETMKFDDGVIKNNAKRFSKERFKEEFSKVVKEI